MCDFIHFTSLHGLCLPRTTKQSLLRVSQGKLLSDLLDLTLLEAPSCLLQQGPMLHFDLLISASQQLLGMLGLLSSVLGFSRIRCPFHISFLLSFAV